MQKTQTTSLFFVLCAGLALSACAKSEHAAAPAAKPSTPQAEPPRTETATGTRYGSPLSSKEAVAAATVLTDPVKYNDQEIKLTGQVGGVCQNKGCWMTIATGEPGGQSVRVTFKDYGFFVPKDSMGKQATVEGRFRVTMLSQEEAQHYADDAAKAGAKPQKIDGPQKTLALVATGVELR